MAFTPVTNNLDWSAVDFLNELTTAQRQREQAVDGAKTTAAVSAGDDVQTAAAGGVIKTLQTNSLGLWSKFFTNADADHDGDANTAAWAYASEAALKTAAGIASGFRRATTIPTDWTDYADAAFSYGTIQAGDIIGPWIFADIQAVYPALTRTGSVTAPGITSVVKRWGENVWTTDWADAKTGAEANWSFEFGFTSACYAMSRGIQRSPATPPLKAQLIRSTVKATITTTAPEVDRIASIYMKPTTGHSGKLPTAIDDIFQTQGDVKEDAAAIVEDVYNLMLVETHAVGEGAQFETTGTIGSIAATVQPANWTAEPTEDGYFVLGWSAAAYAWTIDWAFSDQ